MSRGIDQSDHQQGRRRLCLPLLWVMSLFTPVFLTACGEEEATPEPVSLTVNRTLTARGHEIKIGFATFAPKYAWQNARTIEHGPAILVSAFVTNVGVTSSAFPLSSLYLRHPDGGSSSSINSQLDSLQPGESRRLELVFPLEDAYAPQALGAFAVAMDADTIAHHEPYVRFDGASSPDGTPVPVPAGTRIQGALGFEVTRAELRMDSLCGHDQAPLGTRELHVFATITIPEDAPDDPKALEKLFGDLRVDDEFGRPYQVFGPGWCGPEGLVLKRPMVVENLLFHLTVGEQTERPRILKLRFAGGEGTLAIPPKAP